MTLFLLQGSYGVLSNGKTNMNNQWVKDFEADSYFKVKSRHLKHANRAGFEPSTSEQKVQCVTTTSQCSIASCNCVEC